MKTIRIADIITNDVLNGQGICTSVWVQGCPHHCPGCHNPETWDFNGGTLRSPDSVISEVLELMGKNGVSRNLSILGGEPLCYANEEFTRNLAAAVKKKYPKAKVFCWTGSTLEVLKQKYDINVLLKDIDVLIDGPFIQEQRDITLPLRGSTNQRIIYLKKENK